MPRIITYARLSNLVYNDTIDNSDELLGGRWKLLKFQPAAGGIHGAFQGAAFGRGRHVIIAFKGTRPGRTLAGDVLADLKLGVGMNTHQFAQAADFLATVPVSGKSVSVCGHSLGGAIAQIIGNRHRLPFATFNAPGVALFSRNVAEVATSPLGPARVVGAAVSALRHPVQAAQDLGAVFHWVSGVNFRLGKDAVGCVGVHYGKVIEIPFTGSALAIGEKHKMASMLEALKTSGYRNTELSALV